MIYCFAVTLSYVGDNTNFVLYQLAVQIPSTGHRLIFIHLLCHSALDYSQHLSSGELQGSLSPTLFRDGVGGTWEDSV